MRAIKLLLSAVMILFLLPACRKADKTDGPGETIVNDGDKVVASVRGVVVNENNVPVQGATVVCGTATTSTDAYGAFTFKSISISQNNGYVKVTKAGYFNGNRSFITTAGRTHNLRIKLLPKTITGNFSASSGGTVTLSTGSKVTFASNSITDASGNSYTGTVNVSMAWIDPTSADLGSVIPGDLRGITTAGYERALATYGMLGVELTSASGQVLKIASGKQAEMSIPIPAALQSSAPSSIPLWHFDETKGRWVEEGSATKSGTSYTGKVSHFSFWNCDFPMPGVTLCVNVVNQFNQPLNNATIRLRLINNPTSISYGNTDSLGNVCGLVPTGETIRMEILNICGVVVYTQDIGPFGANTSINVVANISTSNSLTITGTVVNCAGNPVSSGSVFVLAGGGNTYNFPVTAGSFSGSILNCSGTPVTYSVIGIDYATSQNGGTYTFTSNGGTLNTGQLSACGTVLSQFVNMTIDGVPYTWTVPGDSIVTWDQGAFFPYTYYSMIEAYKSVPTMGMGLVVGIQHNGSTGVLPIGQSAMSASLTPPSNSFQSTQITTVNPTVNLTEVGPRITGYLAGNYSINMLFLPGFVIRNVTCNFRVRRP